jgi:hypothetical protein
MDIAHIQATDTAGRAAFRGTSLRVGVQAAAATPPKPSREVVVPQKDFLLFREIGLRPPDQGTFALYELDQKLVDVGYEKRMRVKSALVNCGLISLGRPFRE